MIAAEANKARIKTKPKVLSGPQARLPEDERLAGHNGTALASGIVDENGAFKEVTLRQSTDAPVLDLIALETAKATLFAPAADEAGTSLAVPVVMPIEFYAFQSAEPGGGLVHYTCDQFVRDTDWWKSAHPDAKWANFKLYTFMVGVAVLWGPGKNTIERLKSSQNIEQQWPMWIEACRGHREQLFVDQTGSLAEPVHALAKRLKQ